MFLLLSAAAVDLLAAVIKLDEIGIAWALLCVSFLSAIAFGLALRSRAPTRA